MLREIKGTQRLPRLLVFRVTGTGTAAIDEGNSDATLTDNGTGDYTLTFARPFLRTPVVVVGVLTSNTIHQISSVSTTAARIKTFAGNDGTTAKDAVIHAMILGWDCADKV